MRKTTTYSICESVKKAIDQAAKIENKSASRFIEDTMREKSSAILCKHAQSVSLEKSANECLTNNKKK